MDRVVQIEIVPRVNSDSVDIFALTDDGRLLIRPTKMSDYPLGEWAELTFPPKKDKVPAQSVEK